MLWVLSLLTLLLYRLLPLLLYLLFVGHLYSFLYLLVFLPRHLLGSLSVGLFQLSRLVFG